MNRREIIDIGKAKVTEQLEQIVQAIDTEKVFLVYSEDKDLLVNGLKVLLKDDDKIREITRRIWGI